MSDSQRYKDALRRSLEGLKQPHPLEVLKVTPELARSLDPEALVVATRGLSRALQMSLHSDRASRQSKGATERMQAVRAAQKAIEADPARLRRTYLDEQRSKRTKKPSSEVVAGVVEAKRLEYRTQVQRQAVLSMTETFYSPEAITRVKSGHLLLRPLSIYKKQHADLPLNAVRIIDGKAELQAMNFSDSLQEGEPEVDTIIEEVNPSSGGKFGLVPLEDKTVVIGPNSSYVYETLPSSVMTPGNWYQLRGMPSDSDNNRSVQIYTPTGTTTPITLIGCISQAVAYEVQEFSVQVESAPARAKHYALKSGEDSPIPPRFRHNFFISNDYWENLVTGSLSDLGHNHVLTPQLTAGQVLVVDQGDGFKTMLGTIEHQVAEYY